MTKNQIEKSQVDEIRSAVAAIQESFAYYSAEAIDTLMDEAVKADRASDCP